MKHIRGRIDHVNRSVSYPNGCLLLLTLVNTLATVDVSVWRLGNDGVWVSKL